MDFMPLPDDVTTHEPIPDLGGPDYDNKGFLGYDERQGWNLGALRRGDVGHARSDWDDYLLKRLKNAPSRDLRETVDDSPARMRDAAGSFIQTWILYGIFQEVLNRPVRRNEASVTTVLEAQEKGSCARSSIIQSLFKRLNGKSKAGRIRCITVQSLFQEFLKKRPGIATDPPRAIYLLHRIREASFLLSDLDMSSIALGVSIMPPSVYQALVVVTTLIFYDISALLTRLNNMNFDDICALLPGQNNRLNSFLIRDTPLVEKLKGRGWCPSLAERVGSGLDVGGLYYASLFPESATGQHNNCQEAICVAANIDHDEYRVQHVAEYCTCTERDCDHIQPICGCRSISMPETELGAAFAEKGFPLVRFQDDQIEIVRCTPDVRYVALSHVWSDGRGNPFSNGLPICQLRMIDRYVGEVCFDEDRLFWIDTLCVPIQNPSRNMAILQMARIYASAACVLVLSAELLSINLPSTLDETLFRIFCSTWNTRLWTMQEGMVGSDIAFQFFNTAARFKLLKEETEHVFARATDRSHMVALWAVQTLQQSLMMATSNSRKLSLEQFCKALSFRSTSKPSDVAICGSVLVGSDLGRVLSVPDCEKMQTFWMCQKNVSAGILWYPSGSRLKQDGFRWAPSNLLDERWTIGEKPAAEITPTGLLISDVEAILMENFALPAGESHHICRFSILGLPQRYIFVILKEERHGFSDLGNLCGGQCVLLLLQLPDRQDAIYGALVMPVDAVPKEGCIDIGASISARYLCVVHVYPDRGYHSTLRIRAAEWTDFTGMVNFLSSRPDLEAFTEITKTRQIQSAQRWRIF